MKVLAISATIISLVALALPCSASSWDQPQPTPQIAVPNPNAVQHGGKPGLSKASVDTFNIYGGNLKGVNNRLPEGQFETPFLAPDQQGWTSVDRTENPAFWHESTFNADTLDPAPGNLAMWSGVPAGAPGYATPPGYGNSWDDLLAWSVVTNPTINSDVRLTFDFNHDTEPGYDFFCVEIDSGGVWVPRLCLDGTNKDGGGVFTPVSYDDTFLFTPLMYNNFEVRLRLRVISDSGWSDEDGMWPTDGAAQVDNIRVYINGVLVTSNGDDGVATFSDVGGGQFDREGWTPSAADFVGDFGKVMPQLRDVDPCRDNLSPQIGFVDDGTPPNNGAGQSTGGTISSNWNYGVIGSWVLNYNGGLTNGLVPLNNEWWSPEIDWDDAGSTLDDGLMGGAFIRFSVWQHLPLENGFFWTWQVRSTDGVGDWSPWQSRGFVYFGDGGGTYTNVQADVSDLMVQAPDRVQFALGALDLADLFGSPGDDSTPSPAFDNTSFWRYDLGGPAFATRNIDTFNDGFPTNGSFDYSIDPALMSVRLDMARDISTGTNNIPGDSMIVDVVPTLPGSSLVGNPTMEWILEANPLFDGVRVMPAGATLSGTTIFGWDQWTGSAPGDSARVGITGTVIPDRFVFDFPNEGPANLSAPWQSNEDAMFFPGDIIRYYISATDDQSNTTTLPGDISGFVSGDGYSRVFTIRALPSLRVGMGITQPKALVINDFGHRGGENDFLGAAGQIGMLEGMDFDTYTVRGPSSQVSNGIGSAGAHGATGAQLGGYDCLIYFSGNLSDDLLSDGSDDASNDKGDDLGTLTAWDGLAGDRYMVYFGDNLSSFLGSGGGAGFTYLSTIMGVDIQDDNVRDEIDGQASPIVQPTGNVPGVFSQNYVAFGGCLGINQFDSISPLPGAVSSHGFVNPTTMGLYNNASAGVWHERTVTINTVQYQRVNLTFPYGFVYVNDVIVNAKGPGGIANRALLLQEILQGFGHGSGSGLPTAADDVPQKFSVASNHPNPFNPITTIRFTAPTRGEVSVKVYNIRGELVRTLLNEVVDAGEHPIQWNGTDDQGQAVSSGIYLYSVVGFDQSITRKMTLLK